MLTPATTAPTPADAPVPGARRPDPGSRGLSTLGLILLAGLLAIVVVFQQSGRSAARPVTPAPAAAIEPPPPDQSLILAKLAVKLARVIPNDPNRDAFLVQLDAAAATDAERLRVAIVAGELLGAEAARDRLEALDAALDPPSPLRPDLEVLQRLFAPSPSVPSTDEAERLRTHHGYFGELAAVIGKDDQDPARAALVGGGRTLIAVLLGIAVVIGAGVVAGFGLFITAVVLLASGQLTTRFVRPASGGSVPLELACVFVGGFAALKVVALAAAAVLGPESAGPFTLACQWLLLLVIFYPLLRGVSWRQTRDMLGLYARGRGGVLGEVWAGVLGYLAGIPVFLLGAGLSLLLYFGYEAMKRAAGGPPGPPPENPIIEYFASGNVVLIVALALLATVWAPLVEEIVFRGALQRHLSIWMPGVVAAVPTALVFALMHGYPVLLLGPVLSLGFVFGCLRVWRGSLIACITAHALHNGAITLLLLSVVSVLG